MIEVTQEMIQAATEILWESGRLEYEAEGVDQLVVEEMLRAALVARSSGLENPDGC